METAVTDIPDPQATLQYGPVDSSVEPSENTRGCYAVEDDTVYLHYPEVGSIAVAEGSHVTIDLVAEPLLEALPLILRGVVYGLLSHQRGHLTLHAGAVEVNGAGIGFVGVKRAGKSTTSAALTRLGCNLITDDVLVLNSVRERCIFPQEPKIKLDDNAIRSTLGRDPARFPRVVPNASKKWVEVEGVGKQTARRLNAIYTLRWGDTVAVEPLSGQEAFIELVRHSYAQRFLVHEQPTPYHFKQLAELADRVPVYSFQRPVDLQRTVPNTRHMLEHAQDV